MFIVKPFTGQNMLGLWTRRAEPTLAGPKIICYICPVINLILKHYQTVSKEALNSLIKKRKCVYLYGKA